MSRRRQVFTLILVIVVAVGILIRFVRASLRPQLMERATRIMGMQGADSIGLGWLSDHERLALRTPSTGLPELVCLDMARKQVRPLAAVNPIFQTLTRLSYDKKLSPDGKWLLVQQEVSGSNPPYDRVVALSLDGKRRVISRLTAKYPTLLWFSDSKRWIECVTDKIILHSLDAPGRSRSVPIVHTEDVAPPYLFDPANACRMGPTDQLVTYHWYHEEPDPTLVLYMADLRAEPVKPRAVIIRVPTGVSVETVSVSPDGQRVAWKWFFWNLSMLPALLRHWMPSLAAPHPTTEIWVSRLDGSDLHEVGQINDTYPNHQPNDLDWTQDSKRLLFSVDDALYSVPAD